MKNKLIFLFAGLGAVSCSADDKSSSQPLFSQEQIEAYQSKAPSDVPYLVMKVNSEGEEEVLYYKGDVSFLDASSKAVDGSAIEIKDYELTPVETNNYLTSDIYGGTSFNNYSSYYKYSPNTYCYSKWWLYSIPLSKLLPAILSLQWIWLWLQLCWWISESR